MAAGPRIRAKSLTERRNRERHRFWGRKTVSLKNDAGDRCIDVGACSWSAIATAVGCGLLTGSRLMETAATWVPMTAYGSSAGGGQLVTGKVVLGSHRS